jgi:hypothetical protein
MIAPQADLSLSSNGKAEYLALPISGDPITFNRRQSRTFTPPVVIDAEPADLGMEDDENPLWNGCKPINLCHGEIEIEQKPYPCPLGRESDHVPCALVMDEELEAAFQSTSQQPDQNHQDLHRVPDHAMAQTGAPVEMNQWPLVSIHCMIAFECGLYDANKINHTGPP